MSENYQRLIRDSIRFFFFFQAEDGIRDLTVTGVQTCALPISTPRVRHPPNPLRGSRASVLQDSWARCTARVSERERPVPPISALGGATSYGTLCRSLTRRDSPQRILRAGWGWDGPHPPEHRDAPTKPGSYTGFRRHLGAPHVS